MQLLRGFRLPASKKLPPRHNGHNKRYAQAQNWRANALLQECFGALRGYFTVAIPDQRESVEAVVFLANTEGPWTQADAVPADFLTGDVFILWDEMTLPVLHCNGGHALEHIDDVTAVAFGTWFVSETLDRLVHFGPHGKIRLYSNA